MTELSACYPENLHSFAPIPLPSNLHCLGFVLTTATVSSIDFLGSVNLQSKLGSKQTISQQSMQICLAAIGMLPHQARPAHFTHGATPPKPSPSCRAGDINRKACNCAASALVLVSFIILKSVTLFFTRNLSHSTT
jgi:hypothetical protein